MKKMHSKTYSELIALPTFNDRLLYLSCPSQVGSDTFGSYRYLNQQLYLSKEWKEFTNYIIIRDGGCDLACPEYPILTDINGPALESSIITVHHINPLTPYDLLNRTDAIFDPENAITTCRLTHKAIHYNYRLAYKEDYIPRSPRDTVGW